MTTKTITDQAGDTVRISTGTLTAPTGHVTVKVNEHYLGREYSAAAHADPAALRAALDEVAPLGKYTRTTPDPDDMDGGVAAALIEKEAEQPTAEVRELRSALAREIARGNALQDALDAAAPRPLTPDAITDEMIERALASFEKDRPGIHHFPWMIRNALAAALPVAPDAMTAREHLDAAWEAAHVPADGIIPEGAEYLRHESGGPVCGPLTAGALRRNTPGDRLEYRLVDPPAPARPDAAEELAELIGTWTATEGIAPSQLPTGSLATLADFLAEHGVRVVGEEER